MKILVTGATGAVGPRVIQALVQEGYNIRSFSVDIPTEAMFPQEIEVLSGDVTDQVAVQSAMQGVDAVVHMAALLHNANPRSAMREKYEHVNVGGTRTVVDTAIEAGVQRFVLFSTIAVYGPSNDCVLNEMSPTHPDTFYARTKHAAEQIVLNARRADGQKIGTVLRFGAIYGSRVKGNYERLTRALARNCFIHIGSGFNRRTLVYDKDASHAVALAVSHPAAAGRVFNVTDGGFHTLNEIIESICFALECKQALFSLPVGPMRGLVGLVETGCGAIGLKSPVTMEMINKYTEDIAVDGSLIQKELGFVPQYDLKTGWAETIREMKKCGAL